MTLAELIGEMKKAKDEWDAPTSREVLGFLITLAKMVPEPANTTVTAARIASGFDDHPTIGETLKRGSGVGSTLGDLVVYPVNFDQL